jgi:hypothetical protein
MFMVVLVLIAGSSCVLFIAMSLVCVLPGARRSFDLLSPGISYV